MTTLSRQKARKLALAIIAGMAFLGTCSGIFGNFTERGADHGAVRPLD